MIRNLRFNIIGAGAVGHLWACHLKKSGFGVSVYTRTSRKSQRITVNNALGGDFVCDIDYLSLSQWQEADVTLICVKAFQLSALCQTLAHHKHNDKPIILVMNGMGLVEIVADILPKTPVFQASFVQGALLNQAKANHTSVEHAGNGITHIGDLLGVYEHSHIEPIMSGLNHALPVVSWNENHQETMLLKVCINAIINPVTALKGIKNGGIIVNERLDSLAQTLLQELSPLINELLPSYSYQAVEQQIISVAHGTANNRSSMLRDVELGRKTEIDFINGYLITLAEARLIHINEHRRIVSAIHQLN